MRKFIVIVLIAMFSLIISKESSFVEIPYSSIRIRIIANSNSNDDQNKKLIIKSALNEYLETHMQKKSYEEIDKYLSLNSNIDLLLSDIILKNNLNIDYSSKYGYNYFPEKTYKGLTYPAGNYKSLVITLGDGQGENWWCVLYPPLCLINDNVDSYEYKYLVNELINKYE